MKKEILDSFKAAISWIECKVKSGMTVGYDLDNEPDTNEDCYHNMHTWEIEKATSATKAVAASLRWDIRENQIDWSRVDEVAVWLKRYEYVRKEYKNDFQDQSINAMDYEMDNVSRQMKIYDKLRPQPEPKANYKELATYFRRDFCSEDFRGNIPFDGLKKILTKKRTDIEIACIAYLLWDTKYLLDKRRPFRTWHKKFSELSGYGKNPAEYYPRRIEEELPKREWIINLQFLKK